MNYTYHSNDHYTDIKRYVNQVFKTFKQNKIIRSQEEFSKTLLRRSPHYYSMLMASEQEFSIASLSNLVGTIRALKQTIESNPDRYYSTAYKAFERLEEWGLKILSTRIKEIHIPQHEVVLLKAV